MKIITSNPVMYEADPLATQNEYWLMIDGQNDIQVRHFQAWANKNHGTGLKINGKWNKATRTEYAKFGAGWEKVFTEQFPDYVATSPTGEKRAGKLWDKATNAWVGARDSGLLQQGLEALGINIDTGTPPPTYVANPVPPAPEQPGSPAPKKNKGIGTVLIAFVVIVAGYFVYSTITKKGNTK